MKAWTILILLGMAAAAQGAEVYRWVDEKGVVNYTSYPPPVDIKIVEQKKLGGGGPQVADAPYSLKLAIKNFPVTLYITTCGDTCNNARAYLNKRGVPFTEKNPSQPEELETFKKLTGGGMEVPLLVVGQLKTVKGFLASEWDAALDAAGYPSTPVPGFKPAATPPAQPAAAK